MWSICKKELKTYFYSPIAYTFIAIYLFVTGLFFWLNNLVSASADFVVVLESLTLIFIFTVPVLTMRLFSEERKSKTDQLLLTAPVRLSAVVLGKYLAALILFAITLVMTFVYPIILASLGEPDMAVIFAGYLGFFFLGAAMIALGVLISTLTTSQVTAAVATFAAILFLYMADSFTSGISLAWVNTALSAVSIFSRYNDFTIGVIGLSPIVYFITVSGIFIFLTVRVIERRRWSAN